MADYLIERYVSRDDAQAVERDAGRARLAAEEVSREGTPVVHLRSIFMPEDETCLDLYRAASAETVRRAAARAGLVFDRVTEVSQSGSD